jgi:hypothetical protein
MNHISKYQVMRKIIWAIVVLLPVSSNIVAQEVLHISNNAMVSITNGASLTIAGGVVLDNGSTLLNNGNISLIKNTAGGPSNWTDNTSVGYNYGNGILLLNSNNGSNSHTLASKSLFGRIDVNAGALSFGSDIQSNQWVLSNGPVNTNGFTAIVLDPSAGALQAGASNPGFVNSWFNGKIRRYLSPVSVNTYTLPLGSASRANAAVLDNLQAQPLNNISYVDAFFGPKPGSDAGLVVTEGGTAYNTVNTGGVWYITPNAQPSSGKYDLLLYINGFIGLTDNQFAILERPDASSNAAEWTVPAGSSIPAAGSAGRTVAGGYARRNNSGGFSQFGIGMSLTAFPVTLVDFTARRINRTQVALQWQTASEQHNKGFAIEKRLDRETTFGQLNFVASMAPAGNSTSPLQYNYSDNNNYPGISYYRLKQIDLDDHFSYSIIRAVSGTDGASVTVKMYPNPNRGQFIIRIDGSNKTFHAILADAAGKTVKMFTVNGNNDMAIQGLPAGTYVLQIKDVFGNGASFTEKIIVVR